MGRRGPKPFELVSAADVLADFDLPPFRRKRQRNLGVDRLTLIDDPGVIGLGAGWFCGEVESRDIPMPRGGYRQLVQCLECDRWVLRLYSQACWLGPTSPGRRWQCRHCVHLHYPSEYSGRRPGVSRERLLALIESIRKARRPETQQRRMERLVDTRVVLWQREARWLARFMKHSPAWIRNARAEYVADILDKRRATG
jgi:hypothetical protein